MARSEMINIMIIRGLWLEVPRFRLTICTDYSDFTAFTACLAK